jgi:DNA helicase-2/ATP-dependent DNA helicase PcrA
MSNLKIEDLSQNQKQVVTAQNKKVIVLGGAGSGKTTAALWRARYFLEEKDPKSWHRVLFLTFSRTAVREIANRSKRILGPIEERVEIHTFHSFSNRMFKSFGRYAGYGIKLPHFCSGAEAKILGKSSDHIGYDDLLPIALKIIRRPCVKDLFKKRWPLIICDEFQDTDDRQWELLREISQDGAHLLLLADPNQMIYETFLGSRGVGPKRLEAAKSEVDLKIDLGEPSHRDPSNVIPAMAKAVRNRDFTDIAVISAIRNGKLRVIRNSSDDDLIPLLSKEIDHALNDGCRSIGILGHGNEQVADLSAKLDREHVLVGLPEAHGEALTVMETGCLFGIGKAQEKDLRLRLAVFLASSIRGSNVPPLAKSLKDSEPLPKIVADGLEKVKEKLQESAKISLESLVETAINIWPSLKIISGKRPWDQSARTFGSIAKQIQRRNKNSSEFFIELKRRIEEQRSENFFDLEVGTSKIQLMNFHQTKGREADAVIHVYRNDDYFGKESEPFPGNSRLLYVGLTRARLKNIILIPESPHPLIAPFSKYL